MAMAMRATVSKLPSFSRLFSTSFFVPPPTVGPTQRQPPAEPSPNLFVSGLSKRTTSEGLKEAFAKYGNVINAKVITDRFSGYSRGFGFVNYATTEEAVEGIKGMDGKFLDGWVIFAEHARVRPAPATFSTPRNDAPPPPQWEAPPQWEEGNM